MRSGNYNGAVGGLKFLSAAAVVGIHFGPEVRPFGLSILGMAVPLFMFFAFYYFNPQYGLWPRVRRILYPFWGWGAAYAAYAFVWGFRSLPGFLNQMTLGHFFCRPLYFLSLVILFTLVIGCFVRTGWRLPYWATVAIAVSLLVQYTGLNMRMFGTLSDDVRYPLLRIFELFPYAVLGFAAQTLVGLPAFKLWMMVSGGVLLALGVVASVCGLPVPSGGGYGGVFLLFCSCGLALIAIGAETKAGRFWRTLFETSPCIYYLHMIVGRHVEVFIRSKPLVWLMTFLMCLIGALLLQQIRPLSRFVR